MADSFYVPAGDGTWLATVHTTGPWDPTAQHGGPPSALLGRIMQRLGLRERMRTPRPADETVYGSRYSPNTVLSRDEISPTVA